MVKSFTEPKCRVEMLAYSSRTQRFIWPNAKGGSLRYLDPNRALVWIGLATRGELRRDR
jgi:hypothetical protein